MALLVPDERQLILFWKNLCVKNKNKLAFHSGPVQPPSGEGSPLLGCSNGRSRTLFIVRWLERGEQQPPPSFRRSVASIQGTWRGKTTFLPSPSFALSEANWRKQGFYNRRGTKILIRKWVPDITSAEIPGEEVQRRKWRPRRWRRRRRPSHRRVLGHRQRGSRQRRRESAAAGRRWEGSNPGCYKKVALQAASLKMAIRFVISHLGKLYSPCSHHRMCCPFTALNWVPLLIRPRKRSPWDSTIHKSSLVVSSQVLPKTSVHIWTLDFIIIGPWKLLNGELLWWQGTADLGSNPGAAKNQWFGAMGDDNSDLDLIPAHYLSGFFYQFVLEHYWN